MLLDPMEFVRDDHRTRLREAAGFRAAARQRRTLRPSRVHRLHLPTLRRV